LVTLLFFANRAVYRSQKQKRNPARPFLRTLHPEMPILVFILSGALTEVAAHPISRAEYWETPLVQ
jgi:hypothetical protein